MMENMTKISPVGAMPGFEAMKAQQQAFIKAMTGGMAAWPSGPAAEDDEDDPAKPGDLDEIRKQLADLQAQLAKLDKKG